jgi:type I restriction enzyme S subunit
MTRRADTKTGGREATARHIFGQFALSVGMPNVVPPAGWRWVALTDVARMESGHTPSRQHPEYWDGDIPWIGIRDAKSHHGEIIHNTIQTTNQLGIQNSSARVLPKGTVCLSRTASVGYVVTMGRPMATSQDFANWICSDQLDSRYLVYLLLAEEKSLLRFSSGAIHQTIYYPELKALHICLPPLSEQQRIVTILDEAFAGLTIATASAEKNLNNARELFNGYLHSTFIKEGNEWPRRRLGGIAEVQSGGTPSRANKSYWGGEIPWYSSGELNSLTTVESAERISRLGLDNSNAKVFPEGSLLIGMYDTAAMKMSITDRSSTFNQAIAGVKPNDNIDLIFILHSLLAIKAVLLEQRRGVRQKNLSLEKIKDIEIGLPTVEIQKKVANLLLSYRKSVADLEEIYRRKLLSIVDLKQSILQKAFSGELTAPPSQAFKEAAE